MWVKKLVDSLQSALSLTGVINRIKGDTQHCINQSLLPKQDIETQCWAMSKLILRED